MMNFPEHQVSILHFMGPFGLSGILFSALIFGGADYENKGGIRDDATLHYTENQRLRAENAYLKKLNTLVQERELREKKPR